MYRYRDFTRRTAASLSHDVVGQAMMTRCAERGSPRLGELPATRCRQRPTAMPLMRNASRLYEMPKMPDDFWYASLDDWKTRSLDPGRVHRIRPARYHCLECGWDRARPDGPLQPLSAEQRAPHRRSPRPTKDETMSDETLARHAALSARVDS